MRRMIRLHPGDGLRYPQRAGHTMIELMLVVFVLLFALVTFSQTMGSAAKLGDVNRDTRLALDAVRGMLEILDGEEEFSLVFARYNDDPSDDPATGAPGPNFAVPGLDAVDGDPDGMVGEIVFPAEFRLGRTVLHEGMVEPRLGMPSDLNKDGDQIDDLTDDYLMLPVLVRVVWRGRTGMRQIEVQTLLADR